MAFYNILRHMNFPSRMVELIMRCVSSVSYQVLINGTPSKPFTPTRGLRQGDPLSPFLFTICLEGFSALIRKATNLHELHGLRLGKEGPHITHLLFVDDSLIFLKATTDEAAKLKEILLFYEKVSMQCINF